jgi:hypothetical protein
VLRTRTLSQRGSPGSWMKDQWKRLLHAWRDRPLSMTGSACAVVVAVVVIGQVMQGELYIRELNYPDATTLLMLCGVLTAGLIALRRCSDLQAVALSWVIAVSCLYAYEAIYKWSFYLAPLGAGMPPPELRELILELAVAATLVTGFAHRHLMARMRTWIWLTIFVALWTLWLLVGFPQLDGRVVYVQVLPWHLDRHQVFLINRCSKLALFITYYTLLPPIRDRAHGHASPEAGAGVT